MTRWNWVEPSFFALLLLFALCFWGKEEEGQVLVVVVVERTIIPTRIRIRTKGAIVYMYVLLYIYIYSF